MVEVAQIQKVAQKDGGRVARSMKSWQNAAEQLGQSPAIRKGPLFFLGGGARVVQFLPFMRFNFSFRVFLCKYFYFGNFLNPPIPINNVMAQSFNIYTCNPRLSQNPSRLYLCLS